MSPASPDLSFMHYKRRTFLKDSAIAAGFLGLGYYLRGKIALGPSTRVIAPYGPLIEDKDKLLDLPADFSYQVISRMGETMDDGLRVPGKFDDMAAFEGENGRIVLIRNHELSSDQSDLGPFSSSRFPADLKRSLSYDPGGQTQSPMIGGTTTLVYNPKTGKTEKEFLSLTGCDRNCSGGQMPWGTWITCEETDDMTSARGRKHGYCFEVKADPKLGLQPAVALKALGRFRHEAVALDPVDGFLYLTEDRPDGLLYRFEPERQGDFTRGKLCALALEDHKSADLRNTDQKAKRIAEEGKPMAIRWIEMKDIQSPQDDLRQRGYNAGAARFARAEGIYYSEGVLYLCCTDGGPGQQGQIFRILPRHFGDAKPALELFLEPDESDLVTNGDNLCAAPNGDLIICEDLITVHKEKKKLPHLRGVTPEGQIFNIARIAVNTDEFCGSCFSPDDKILFVNLQTVGLTFAIKGPWRHRRK
ncbi:MAG: alkaline phosphatase PhoX [Roseibacillus sp.]